MRATPIGETHTLSIEEHRALWKAAQRRTEPAWRRTPEPEQHLFWRTLAACRDKPVTWFYPERHPDPRALRCCMTCPVRRACDEAADHAHEPYGIWGGKDRTPRRNRHT